MQAGGKVRVKLRGSSINPGLIENIRPCAYLPPHGITEIGITHRGSGGPDNLQGGQTAGGGGASGGAAATTTAATAALRGGSKSFVHFLLHGWSKRVCGGVGGRG